ncbi:MAG: RRXRR domain-containing protein [Coleofasciculus sp. C2-GNP5-27]
MSNTRVPVVDPKGKPLMPTTTSRARRWMEHLKAVAKWSDLSAMPGVKSKMDYRSMLNRGRRARRINRQVAFNLRNHRQERFNNRRQSKLPPSTRANCQLELRIISQLCQILPISIIVYENVKADVDLTSGRKSAKSGKGLGQRAIGKCKLIARSTGLVVSGVL